MISYVITMLNNSKSVDASERCIKSANKFGYDPFVFKAITPEDNPIEIFKKENLPLDKFKTDSRYSKLEPCMCCFLSHRELWKKSVQSGNGILVLEHDAVFTNKIEVDPRDNTILDNKYGVIGINDPRGATRKSHVYHTLICESRWPVQRVPQIDDVMIPQGLAGNSAYIIKPWAAKKVIQKVKEIGAWPNDALLCYQIFGIAFLGVTKKYYTRVQGLPSTTTL